MSTMDPGCEHLLVGNADPLLGGPDLTECPQCGSTQMPAKPGTRTVAREEIHAARSKRQGWAPRSRI